MTDKPLPPKFPIKQLVEEIGREIGLRRSVYPGLVAKHKLSQAEAEVRIARMERIYMTLKWLEKHEDILRAFVDAHPDTR